MGTILPKSAQNILLKKFGNKNGIPNADIYFSRLCSCVAKQGVYDPTCPYCIYGYIYDIEPTPTLLIRTAMNMKTMSEKFVSLYQGGCRLTIMSTDLNNVPVKAFTQIARGDVVVMKNDKRRDRDLCEMGRRDNLLAYNVSEILNVSERQILFEKDLDYKIDIQDKKTSIIWLNRNKPKQYYSVEYISDINYLVWDDMPKPRGSTDATLPREVYCRLRPYFDPSYNKSMEVLTNYSDIDETEEKQ